ncbi:MAG TPA: GNAT family N-acetyltransferase [Acidimicrobiales bacterium]|nr:GNAT family N-acetyltransferase [Acidimicrobiales bacterium]
MAPEIAVTWPRSPTDELSTHVHRIIHAVTALGGAVGWLEPPSPRESDAWLLPVLDEVGRGDAALCVVSADGTPAALGTWRRDPGPIFAHRAQVSKVMAHPDSRGLGLGELVVSSLVGHARTSGIETLRLSARGNNHLAIELYERLGFRVWGRLPNAIEVGNLRFDDVHLYLQFERPETVTLVGSAPEGPGSATTRNSGGP